MYKDLNELQLAARCRDKDNGAAEELYRRYAARLFTLCRRYCSTSADAEDLMQDAFIKALDKIGSFKYMGVGSLPAWISRIAINLALGNMRKQRREITSGSETLPDDLPEPDNDAVAAIPQEKLLEMIATLPETRRAVFNMYCIDGFSHREIGKMLGISEKGSASVLAKARAQLKKEIYRYLNEE